MNFAISWIFNLFKKPQVEVTFPTVQVVEDPIVVKKPVVKKPSAKKPAAKKPAAKKVVAKKATKVVKKATK
jgi:hypothetical protein